MVDIFYVGIYILKCNFGWMDLIVIMLLVNLIIVIVIEFNEVEI